MAGRRNESSSLPCRSTIPKHGTTDGNHKYTNTAKNTNIRPSPPPPPALSLDNGSAMFCRTSSPQKCLPTKVTTPLHDSSTTNNPDDSDDQLYLRKYNIIPDELSPLQLVQRHKNSLPLRVFVSKGFYGSNEHLTLSEGDIYNIHFVKKTNVVTVEDCSKVAHTVSVTSSVQFGTLYNPEGNILKALEGYKYPKVSDIVAISPLPKAIKATVQFRGTAADNSVEKNEIFIIKEIKLKGNRRHLAVYSVTNSTNKYLFESCEGHFSTKPYDVRLFLPEILEHFPQPFPTTCYLFVNSETSPELSHHLTSSPVTLIGQSTDLSLIASSHDQKDISQPLLVEIPVGLNIEVQVMQPKEDTDTESLSKQTYELMENFDISKVVQCDYESDRPTPVLATQVRSGSKGIELVQSPTMKQWIDVHTNDSTKMPVSKHVSSVLDLVECNKTSSHCSCGMQDENNVLDPAPYQQQLPEVSQEIQIHELGVELKKLDSKLTNDLASLKENIWKLSQTVNSYVQSCTSAKKGSTHHVSNTLFNCGGMNADPTQPVYLSSQTEVYLDCVDRDGNIKFLRTLDNVDVVRLFHTMGLQKYNETIAQELITGDILLECTEEVLEKDLHIASKLHRVRLMKLIDGSHSAKSILSGEGTNEGL